MPLKASRTISTSAMSICIAVQKSSVRALSSMPSLVANASRCPAPSRYARSFSPTVAATSMRLSTSSNSTPIKPTSSTNTSRSVGFSTICARNTAIRPKRFATRFTSVATKAYSLNMSKKWRMKSWILWNICLTKIMSRGCMALNR